MGKYAERIKSTPVSQSVNACQTWSNGQAFRHGFSDAKTACFEIAAEADAEIERLQALADQLKYALDEATAVNWREGNVDEFASCQYWDARNSWESERLNKGENHE